MKKIALLVLFMATTALPEVDEINFESGESSFFDKAYKYQESRQSYIKGFRTLARFDLLGRCGNGDLQSCDNALAQMVHIDNLIKVEVAKKQAKCKNSLRDYLGLTSDECRLFKYQQSNYKDQYENSFEELKKAFVDGSLDDHKDLVRAKLDILKKNK